MLFSSDNLLVNLLLFCVGLYALLKGSDLFVDSASALAKRLKVSELVIGLTVVSMGTSLPELATSIVAAIKGEKEIAVGNVVGSNIFNILAILGIVPLISPIHAAGIEIVDLSVMVGISILMSIMMLTGKVVRRWEGACLFWVYAGYTAWLFIKGL